MTVSSTECLWLAWVSALRHRTPAFSCCQQPERGSWIGTRRVAPCTFPHPLRLEPYVRLLPHTAQHLWSFSEYASSKRSCAFPSLHGAFSVVSLRMREGPLFRSSQRLGACAVSPHPGVHGFPVRGLLCPIRLSPLALSFRATFPSHYFPTALNIHRGVSRGQHGGLTQHDTGGVFISLPRPRFAAPQSLDLG